MKMQYTLLSGETVEFSTPSGALGSFLKRVLAAAKDPAVTERELADLVHGPENPLLDAELVAGKTIATAEVYRDPMFHAMLDCIARKRIPPGAGLASARTRYTMTVPEAAKQLGISESAVRQAIYSTRLRARKDGGTYYVDPNSVAGYRVSRRGPRRREAAVKLPPGGVLEARTGQSPEASFRIKHPRDDAGGDDRAGGEWVGELGAGWHRIGVLGSARERSRFWEIEPADGESVLHFEGFYLRGGFRIVETVGTSAKARAAYRAFLPK
jgi:excisionase family DNA binding protein